MQFVDNVTISIFAGDGGDGSAAARREKFIPYGGPAGGDGADGGDVLFRATSQLTTLEKFLYQTRRKADDGGNGQQQKKHGKRGHDLIIDVPVGTVVSDAKTKQPLVALFEEGQLYRIAKAGRGGWGNPHFKSSTTQFPSFSLRGEPGERTRVSLQLQLAADVALVGMPNVGKSTLISSLTNTKSKIGAYPFTTIVPHIGVHQPDDDTIDQSLSIIDIPGLIADASRGVGMGYQFLQHVLRAKTIVFVADIDDEYTQQWATVWREYTQFITQTLSQQYAEHGSVSLDVELIDDLPCVIARLDDNADNSNNNDKSKQTILYKQYILFVANKADAIDFDTEIIDDVKQTSITTLSSLLAIDLPETALSIISGQTTQGCESLIATCRYITSIYGFVPPLLSSTTDDDVTPFAINDATDAQGEFLVREGYVESLNDDKVWEISYPDFAYRVYITPWGHDEAELWFWQYMVKQGYLKELQRNGVERNDILRVRSPYSTMEDRYIRRE